MHELYINCSYPFDWLPFASLVTLLMMTLTAKIIQTVASFRWTITTSLSNSVWLLAYIVTSEMMTTSSNDRHNIAS